MHLEIVNGVKENNEKQKHTHIRNIRCWNLVQTRIVQVKLQIINHMQRKR